MNASEFDGLLRKRFEQHEFAYHPEDWDKLRDQLDEVLPERTKSRRRPFFFLLLIPGMAASVAAFACCVYLLKVTGRHPFQAPSYSHAVPVSRPAHAIRRASEAPTHLATAAVPAVSTGAPTASTPAAAVSAVPALVKQEVQLFPVADAAANTRTDKQGASDVIITNIPKATSTTTYKRIDLAFDDAVFDNKTGRGTTSLSVGGGFNYGSMNAGYTLGLNARRNLGGKLYVEGDVAMVNNATTRYSETVTQTVVPATSRNIPVTARMTGTSAKQTSTLAVPQNTDISVTTSRDVQSQNTSLYYVQVAPTIGYQLYPELSVGIGPDFQQLLQSDEKKVVYETNQQATETLPVFDVGVQAKAEVSVSRKVKAGLQYRKGVNSMLRNGSNIDRNYMQVQLKFLMFNR